MSRDPYADSRRRRYPVSGTAKRDQFGNLIPGESSGVDQNGQPIPMGMRPREQGLHTGSLSQPMAAAGPDAFDRRFGRPEAPPRRAVVTPAVAPAPVAPAPAVQPVAKVASPSVTAATPAAPAVTSTPATAVKFTPPAGDSPSARAAFLDRRAPGASPAVATPTPTPAPVATPAPVTRMVAAPDAFGATRTNMNGGTERWQPSETAQAMGGTGKWVGSTGVSPQTVALPSDPAARQLLMETRARDAAARQPEPVWIPGGDPGARVFNKRTSTPILGRDGNPVAEGGSQRPVAMAPAPVVANNAPDPRALAAAGTGQVLHTAYGDVSSTTANRPDAFAKGAPITPAVTPGATTTPAAPPPVKTFEPVAPQPAAQPPATPIGPKSEEYQVGADLRTGARDMRDQFTRDIIDPARAVWSGLKGEAPPVPQAPPLIRPVAPIPHEPVHQVPPFPFKMNPPPDPLKVSNPGGISIDVDPLEEKRRRLTIDPYAAQ